MSKYDYCNSSFFVIFWGGREVFCGTNLLYFEDVTDYLKLMSIGMQIIVSGFIHRIKFMNDI